MAKRGTYAQEKNDYICQKCGDRQWFKVNRTTCHKCGADVPSLRDMLWYHAKSQNNCWGATAAAAKGAAGGATGTASATTELARLEQARGKLATMAVRHGRDVAGATAIRTRAGAWPLQLLARAGARPVYLLPQWSLAIRCLSICGSDQRIARAPSRPRSPRWSTPTAPKMASEARSLGNNLNSNAGSNFGNNLGMRLIVLLEILSCHSHFLASTNPSNH